MLVGLASIETALGAALACATVCGFVLWRKGAFVRTPQSEEQKKAIYLFQDSVLVDATPDAFSLIPERPEGVSDLDAVTHVLAEAFPTLRGKLDSAEPCYTRIQSRSDSDVFLDVERSVQNHLRLTLSANTSLAYESALLGLSRAALAKTASLVNGIAAHSPQIIWQQDGSGQVIWANDAYASLAGQAGRAPFATAELGGTAQKTRRVALDTQPDDPTRWFDIVTVPDGAGFLHFANETTDLVRADTARSEFVKTLGKTFAELATGLAIFDKNRQLTMFNPALVDMTNLPFDFLSAQPEIDTVLDRLRELRMMPEPKNYSSWREQFTAVETAAKNGTYSKHWSLPDGQTLSVTGRPYPNGAFALLFEDITADVSLTRRFRLDIETGQAVLDTLSDAIAVFSATGTLVMSNQAYTNLWSGAENEPFEHRELRTELARWQDRCIPSQIWRELRDYIQLIGTRKPWLGRVLMDDGRRVQCHANPIAGGMTMVRFVAQQPQRPEIGKLMQADPAIRAASR